ncbi:DNA primase [Shewanella mangrovi]|uniref:DNA primase n=1 Tax=Shewanella mangrovi TaxID=1515746 RepID=A0A094J9T5_9GAMM|nr:DNA primase [Shewanella mangrovi]KFZ36002.1 DNA primase [Shewanella mangrovi]
MAIPRDFINELIARTDIVDLIERKVPLKKAGKNYAACCPFHSEKSPSFTVSRDKQFYHCFGCGAHGNAIDFVMEYDRLEFPDAIEELAGQLGLEVPHERGKGPRRDEGLSRDLYQLMEASANYFQQQLRHHPNQQQVNAYVEKRGLSKEIVEQFSIGYAPDGWDNLMRTLGQHADAQEKLLAGGMLIANEQGRRYDRFRDRLMFPIRDRRGRVVAFGGRVLGDGTPKYLNSPETPIFHKGHELYGLYELRQRHRDPQRVMIVEGYMDVVALAQFGIDYAVASLGTSTTSEQFQMLLRSAKEVVCCYDGDNAGKEAAWRAMETALPLMKPGDNVRFMFLAQGEDPDSMVRQIGKAQFEVLIDQALTINELLFNELTKQHGSDKASLAKHGITLIEKIQDEVLQNMMLEELATRVQMNNAEHMERSLGLTLRAKRKKVAKPSLKGRGTPLRLAIALLVQKPALGYQLPLQPALQHLKMPGVELLIELLSLTRVSTMNSAQLLEHYRETEQFSTLKKLAQWEHQVADEHLQQGFKEALVWLNNQYIEQRYQALSMKQELTREEKVQLQKLINAMKAQH